MLLSMVQQLFDGYFTNIWSPSPLTHVKYISIKACTMSGPLAWLQNHALLVRTLFQIQSILGSGTVFVLCLVQHRAC